MFEEIVELLLDYSEIGKEKIREQSDLVCDLGLNSIDMVNIIMIIKDKYSINVPYEDAMKLRTIRDMMDYIQNKLS